MNVKMLFIFCLHFKQYLIITVKDAFNKEFICFINQFFCFVEEMRSRIIIVSKS